MRVSVGFILEITSDTKTGKHYGMHCSYRLF
jgi:hypothetical protein